MQQTRQTRAQYRLQGRHGTATVLSLRARVLYRVARYAIQGRHASLVRTHRDAADSTTRPRVASSDPSTFTIYTRSRPRLSRAAHPLRALTSVPPAQLTLPVWDGISAHSVSKDGISAHSVSKRRYICSLSFEPVYLYTSFTDDGKSVFGPLLSALHADCNLAPHVS